MAIFASPGEFIFLSSPLPSLSFSLCCFTYFKLQRCALTTFGVSSPTTHRGRSSSTRSESSSRCDFSCLALSLSFLGSLGFFHWNALRLEVLSVLLSSSHALPLKIRCAGVLQAVRMRQVGYPVRKELKDFLYRYRVLLSLLPQLPGHTSPAKQCEMVLKMANIKSEKARAPFGNYFVCNANYLRTGCQFLPNRKEHRLPQREQGALFCQPCLLYPR